MTLLSDRPEAAEPDASSPPPEPPPAPAGRPRWLGVTALGVLAAVAVYVFFGAFVTRVWYETRQRALAGAGISLVRPAPGRAAGVLQVDSPFVLNVQIVQGDSPADLRAGPGHQPGTPLPGSRGNSVVYGHARLWGGPFGLLHEATVGTELYLRTPADTTLAYHVIAVHDVGGARLAAYLGSSTDYRLTLVTDAGGRFSDRRLVVVAVSGQRGVAQAAPRHLAVGPPAADRFGGDLLELAGWIAAAAAVALLLRGRLRHRVVAAATLPLLLGAMVALYLEIALFFSPLA